MRVTPRLVHPSKAKNDCVVIKKSFIYAVLVLFKALYLILAFAIFSSILSTELVTSFNFRKGNNI